MDNVVAVWIVGSAGEGETVANDCRSIPCALGNASALINEFEEVRFRIRAVPPARQQCRRQAVQRCAPRWSPAAAEGAPPSRTACPPEWLPAPPARPDTRRLR